MKTTRGRVVVPLFVALAVTVAAACAGRYGSIRWDTGVGSSFETAQVLPGHRYYTTGPESVPEAILALREDRPLQGNLWREVAMTPKILAGLVSNMRGTRDVGPYGRVVLDDRGERIGAWCSYLRAMPVQLLEDGGVLISPPVGTMENLEVPSVERAE